jgi:hypothetical protein
MENKKQLMDLNGNLKKIWRSERGFVYSIINKEIKVIN